MNDLQTDIFLYFIAINIIVYMFCFVCFLARKQKLEEAEQEIKNSKQELEKKDSINIINENICIFLKDYNENSTNLEIVLDHPKSFLIKSFPSIAYYPVLDMVILTIEFNEKYEKLLKTYSNYYCADIYYLRNTFKDFFIRRIEKTKYNEIIFEFARNRYLKNKETRWN